MRLRKSRSERTLAPHELEMAGRSHGLDRAEPMGRWFKSCPQPVRKAATPAAFSLSTCFYVGASSSRKINPIRTPGWHLTDLLGHSGLAGRGHFIEFEQRHSLFRPSQAF